jgi:PPM family protein phosphatase
MSMRAGLELASLSDVGCQRQTNEDSCGYWEPEDTGTFERLGRLLVVADGMGGHEGGQIASRIAVEAVQETYSASSEADAQSRLLEAFREAHQRIRQRARESPLLRGMGTTCTAFALVGGDVYFAHIGDSHLYLLHQGNLRLLTRDHSLVARLIETGVIRAEEAENHPQKHVLTAALGVAGEIDPDFPAQPVAVEKSDVLLLCTDGLWGQASDSEIEQVLSAQPPTDACRSLVDLAKRRGGPDNITVQIARIS